MFCFGFDISCNSNPYTIHSGYRCIFPHDALLTSEFLFGGCVMTSIECIRNLVVLSQVHITESVPSPDVHTNNGRCCCMRTSTLVHKVIRRADADDRVNVKINCNNQPTAKRPPTNFSAISIAIIDCGAYGYPNLIRRTWFRQTAQFNNLNPVWWAARWMIYSSFLSICIKQPESFWTILFCILIDCPDRAKHRFKQH